MTDTLTTDLARATAGETAGAIAFAGLLEREFGGFVKPPGY